MVERFYGPLIGFEMNTGARGDYVRFSDHKTALAAEKAKVERLTSALHDIADSDDIDNALDPARNKRIARAALKETEHG